MIFAMLGSRHLVLEPQGAMVGFIRCQSSELVTAGSGQLRQLFEDTLTCADASLDAGGGDYYFDGAVS